MFKQGILKVAAATPKIIVGDIEFNQKEILKILNETKAGAIVFPELTITGYSASDLFYQESFIIKAKNALKTIMEETIYQGIYILGAPLELYGILYNCAVVFKGNQILGVVPKHYLPNYHEFYEKRWFHTGFKTEIKQIQLFGKMVPFGYLIFEDEHQGIRFGVEICQDVWAAYTPSDDMSLAGANLIFNLSASTERVNKPSVRRTLVLDHSRKQMTAYVYTSTGHFESTSEVVFSPHKLICCAGQLMKEDNTYSMDSKVLVADVDLKAINYQKRMDSTYRDMHMLIQHEYAFVPFEFNESENFEFEEKLNQHPFLYQNNYEESLLEANQLQVYALMNRLESLPKSANKIVIGISGGLDSTLALLVSHQAMIKLNRNPKDIIAVTMPANATSKNSLNIALELMSKLGVTNLEIPIKASVDLHLKSIDHEEKDVTYENAQARIRTLILMDLANKHGGFVLGTGDLSEIALGFMTYNGDQMSMYAINAGLPKTWIKALVEYHSNHDYQMVKEVLQGVLSSPISPELLEDQKTEEVIGRYDINDFILYHHLECGADKEKIMWLIKHAFDLSFEEGKTYVNRFFKRFYEQQFKRQTLPEGPKILGISLSPRGQYRLPSDVKVK
ncbi:MAG: NAD(+) synthase [Acholeplasmataceae bacterium]|nr:NAD(+) synthase [Acholeplasmataceae bacterium]MDD4193935.1 NAD(+) synthase [Acholeplasmataceae bacterium]